MGVVISIGSPGEGADIWIVGGVIMGMVRVVIGSWEMSEACSIRWTCAGWVAAVIFYFLIAPSLSEVGECVDWLQAGLCDPSRRRSRKRCRWSSATLAAKCLACRRALYFRGCWQACAVRDRAGQIGLAEWQDARNAMRRASVCREGLLAVELGMSWWSSVVVGSR